MNKVAHKKIKVLLVSQRRNQIVEAVYNDKNVDIVGIVESAPRFYKEQGFFGRVRYRFLMMSWLVPERNLKLFSKVRKIPYFFLHKKNEDQLATFIQGCDPELTIVYSMSQLLPEDVLELPKFGTINVHPSCLPLYRGPDPWFWIYYHLEDRQGVTIHYVDKGEDTGAIIAQGQFEVELGMPFKKAYQISMNLGARLLKGVLNEVALTRSRLEADEQPQTSQTLRAKRVPSADYAALIDVSSWPVERLWHMLNGLEDWQHVFWPHPHVFQRLFRWNLVGYEQSVSFLGGEEGDHLLQVGEEVGKPMKVGRGRFVVHCVDGSVNFERRFSLSRLIRLFLGVS